MAVSSSLETPGRASDATHVGARTIRRPLMPTREVAVAPNSPYSHALSVAGHTVAADVAARGPAGEQSVVPWIAGRQGGRGPPCRPLP